MALATFDVAMPTRQRPARETVIKGAFVQLGDVVVGPDMLSVALIAGLFDRHTSVIPPPVPEPLLDLLVTIQALRVGRALERCVTPTARRITC